MKVCVCGDPVDLSKAFFFDCKHSLCQICAIIYSAGSQCITCRIECAVQGNHTDDLIDLIRQIHRQNVGLHAQKQDLLRECSNSETTLNKMTESYRDVSHQFKRLLMTRDAVHAISVENGLVETGDGQETVKRRSKPDEVPGPARKRQKIDQAASEETVQSLHKRLLAADAQIQQLEQECEEGLRLLNEVRKRNCNLQATSREANEALKEKTQCYEKRISEFEEKLRREKEAHENDRLGLQKSMGDLQRSCEHLEEKIQRIEADRDKKTEEIKALGIEIRSSQTAYDELCRSQQHDQEQFRHLQDAHNKSVDDLELANEKISSGDKKVEAMERSHKHTDRQMCEQNLQLQQAVNAHKQTIQELHNTNTTQSTESTAARDNASSLQLQVSELRETLAQNGMQFESYKERTRKMKEEYKAEICKLKLQFRGIQPKEKPQSVDSLQSHSGLTVEHPKPTAEGDQAERTVSKFANNTPLGNLGVNPSTPTNSDSQSTKFLRSCAESGSSAIAYKLGAPNPSSGDQKPSPRHIGHLGGNTSGTLNDQALSTAGSSYLDTPRKAEVHRSPLISDNKQNHDPAPMEKGSSRHPLQSKRGEGQAREVSTTKSNTNSRPHLPTKLPPRPSAIAPSRHGGLSESRASQNPLGLR